MKYFENEDKKELKYCSDTEKLCLLNAMNSGGYQFFCDGQWREEDQDEIYLCFNSIYRVPRPALTVNEAVRVASLVDFSCVGYDHINGFQKCLEIMKQIEGYKPETSD